MKKERAIELLKNFNLYDEPNCMGYWDCDECVEALYMAIEALEQQTCDNCKYSEETDGMNCYECLKGMSDNFEALQQEQKRGKWQRFNYSDGDVMECTNCGYRDWRDRWLEDEVHNYCPNCGARMELKK